MTVAIARKATKTELTSRGRLRWISYQQRAPAIRSLGPFELLPKPATGNRVVVVITDQYTKLGWAIRSPITTASRLARCSSMNASYHTRVAPFSSWIMVCSLWATSWDVKYAPLGEAPHAHWIPHANKRAGRTQIQIHPRLFCIIM